MLQNLLGNQMNNQIQAFLNTPQGQQMAAQYLQSNPQVLQQLAPQAQAQQQPTAPTLNQQALQTFQQPNGNGNPLEMVSQKVKEYEDKINEHAAGINALISGVTELKNDLSLLKEGNVELKKRLTEVESLLTNP